MSKRTGRATMHTAWHEGKRVDNESEPCRWGQGESALTATNSQHVLGKILVRLLTMRTIQELKQGEYSVTSGTLQNASALR